MSDYEPKCKKTLPIIFDDRMPASNLTPKLVNRVNNNTEDLKNLYEETETIQEDIESLQEDVDDKLDIPETAGTAGQVLTSDGEGGAVWAEVGAGEIVVDPTLTVEGAAADAKKTGDEITQLKQDNNELKSQINLIGDDSYNMTERTASTTATGWRLNESDGLCSSNNDYQILKFTVNPGDIVKIVSDDRFQFQTIASVPSSGTSNRVDKTYQTGEYILEVPEMATYLIVSTPTTSNAHVYHCESKTDEIESYLPKISGRTRNLINIDDWSSYADRMKVQNSQITNVSTDSRSYLFLVITTRNGGSDVQTIYSAEETTRRRVLTFTASGNATAIRFKHNGSTTDLIIDLNGLTIVSSEKYTLSFDITSANPTIAGGIVIDNVQLEAGESATAYIPHYSATDHAARQGLTATQEEVDDISGKMTKNLVNKTDIVSGFINGNTISTTASGKTCFTKLEVGKRYVFTRTITDNRQMTTGFAQTNAIFSSVTESKIFSQENTIRDQSDNDYPYVFTVPSGYPYFAITYYYTGYESAYTEQQILDSLYLYEYNGQIADIAKIAHKSGDLNPIYNVFSNEIISVADEIIQKSTSKALLLGIITDTHNNSTYDIHNKVSMYNMEKVNEYVSFDVAINMGDLIDGGGEKSEERVYMRNGIRRLIEVKAKKFAALIGNHDNNGLAGSSEMFTSAELYGMMLRMDDTMVVRDGITSNYYIDYPSVSIRLAFVDSVYQTQGFSEITINWVSEILTNLPSGYKVVFISHEPTRWSLISTASGSMTGSTEMETVLAEHTEKICGWIHGHTHFDNVSYVMTFPEISITCGKPDQFPSTNFPPGATAPARTTGDVTQDAWDAVLILPNENKFEFVRFGAGESRTVPFRQ